MTFATLLAQTGAGTTTVGANVPSVAYWLALILVAAGLGLIVIVALAWLRGRDSAETISPSAEEQAFAAYAPASTGALGAMPSLAEESAINQSNPIANVGTTQEAERLLRLMGEAEELCGRLARDLDERADRLERLMARANGMLGTTLAEQRMPPAPQPQPAPTPPPQPYQPPMQPRPEVVTRPIGVPVMAGAPTYQPAPIGAPAANVHQHAAPAPSSLPAGIPAPAPRMPGPPPIPQGQYYGQPVPAPHAHAPHVQSHATSNGAPGMYGQAAYPAEAEALAQQIFRLADAGLSPGEIAQRLGQHTGKVELIIALRNA